MNDKASFFIMKQKINLISDETDYGNITFAEIDGTYYCQWQAKINISTAIHAWQQVYNIELSMDQIKQILIDNQIIV